MVSLGLCFGVVFPETFMSTITFGSSIAVWFMKKVSSFIAQCEVLLTDEASVDQVRLYFQILGVPFACLRYLVQSCVDHPLRAWVCCAVFFINLKKKHL